jgi:hypothetical protein
VQRRESRALEGQSTVDGGAKVNRTHHETDRASDRRDCDDNL